MNTLTLKEEAYVKGPKVTVSDVATVEGDDAESLASIDLGPAAPPGGVKRLDAGLIMSRVRGAGGAPDQVDFKGARSVLATTLCQTLAREEIAEELRRFIEESMPWTPEDAQIDVALPAQELTVPEGEIAFQWKPDPGYRYLGSGGFRGQVAVDGAVARSVVCKATIEAYAQVVIAATDIPRGKPLAASDLIAEKRPMSTLRDTVFREPSDLLGFMAKSMIAPGEVITRRCVAPQLKVKRGQLVTVEARAGGLRVETQARVESDGAEGDVVNCVNMNSKQVFQGVVRSDGAVEVQ